MMKSIIKFLLLTLISISIYSCGPDIDALPGDDCKETVEILAGQTIPVGSLSVWNDNTYLYVEYNLTGDWYLKETHVYAGPCDEIPLTNSGNPRMGQFPYHGTFSSPYTEQHYIEKIPLEDLDDCFCIVAHAAVVRVVDGTTEQEETAFGKGGKEFEGSRWGWYLEYCKKDCPPPPGGNSCETAFAGPDTGRDGCFIDTGLFTRWGWRLELSKTYLQSGALTYPIWGGAGQCDQTKGSKVGDLTISYDVATDEITISVTMLSGFTLDESQAWVGDASDPWPTNSSGQATVAPGQYGNQHTLSSDTTDSYTLDVSNLDNDFYLIYHSVACGVYN